MLPTLAPLLENVWGPFRLFGSLVVLIGLAASATALLTAWLTPKLTNILPTDKGRIHTPSPETSQGKPTGAGCLFVLISIPVLAFVLPFSWQLWATAACLTLAMATGFLDDASSTPWSEYRKGGLDLGVGVVTSFILWKGGNFSVWLPFVTGTFDMPFWLFIPVVSGVLWLSINTTNCTDGVDGLAGALTLLTLAYLGAFHYLVIGNTNIAEYLLVPHNPEGAYWALLIFTLCGALAGYLWHNAEPSSVLMGDAGSRLLGLLVGVAVITTGNPFLLVVAAPVVLVNGGLGMLKVALLRGLKRLGADIAPEAADAVTSANPASSSTTKNGTQAFVNFLHSIRFPLHDHVRRKLGWSNAQVLMRFLLIQTFLIPILLGLLVKLR